MKSKLNSLNDALDRLGELLIEIKELKSELDVDEFDVYRDAAIRRFEFSFELSWKVLKAMNDYLGTPCNSPKDCVRTAAQNSLITNPEEWIDFVNKRNLSSHVYDEGAAQEIYETLPNFEKCARSLVTVVVEKLKSQPN